MNLIANFELAFQEVDDDLDGYVSKQEFETMYRRCISDQSDLEPRQLYNLVTFLMYDKEFKGRVTIEETLQILFVRHGRKNLDEEIKAIFGEEERNKDTSEEPSITYAEYVSKITRRALNKQAALLGKRKNQGRGQEESDLR